MTLVIAVGLAWIVLAGAAWPVVGAGLLLWIAPPLGGMLLAAALVREVVTRRRHRARAVGDVATFLRAIAADTRSGHTFRHAIEHSSSPLVGPRVRRLCTAGAPMDEISAAMADGLGSAGDPFRGLASISEITGAGIADALDTLADQAELTAELDAERRVAVAQARFSALVVGVVPLAVAAGILAVRGVPEPGGAPIVVPMVLGAVLMVSGSVTVLTMSARAVTP